MRIDPIGKLWTSRYRISRSTKDAQVSQEKLLVARNTEQHQEVCLIMLEVSTEQGITHEKSRKTLSARNASRIIAGN